MKFQILILEHVSVSHFERINLVTMITSAALFGRPIGSYPLQHICGSGRRDRRPDRPVGLSRLAAETKEPGNLLGPDLSPLVSSEEAAASIAEALSSVEMPSDSSVNYSKFMELLEAKDFQKADDEGRSLLLQLAGAEAQSRGWIYFTEVATIPDADMKTIDDLWKASSNGKFGYSVQKRIFKQSMGRWTKFFKAIDWTVGENNYYRKWPSEFVYSLDAKPGHLPVTNCLRGTQLLEGLMHHKALETETASTDFEKKWTSI